MYSDPCQWQGSLLSPAVGPTVDDPATALVAQKGRNATAPTDVMLGGYPAKRVELSIPADLDRATCDEGVIRTWVAPGEDAAHSTPDTEDLGMHSGQLNVVYIVDFNGDRLIIDTWHKLGTSARGLGGARCHPGVDAHRALTVQRVESATARPACLDPGPYPCTAKLRSRVGRERMFCPTS